MEENKREVLIASITDVFMSGSALMQNLEIENYSAASLPPFGQLHTASIIVDFMSGSDLIQNLENIILLPAYLLPMPSTFPENTNLLSHKSVI